MITSSINYNQYFRIKVHLKPLNLIFRSNENMDVVGKTSLRLKFGHFDAQIALRYAVPLFHNHNQSLLVMKQSCDPSKVDDCCVMLVDGLRRPSLFSIVKNCKK